MQNEPNRELRPQMNAADAHRRQGNYVAAREAYVAIWEAHKSIAAAINASVLYEATGDLEGAIFLMEQVSVATGAPRVNQRLAELNREAAELLGLSALSETESPAERVAAHAVAEIRSVVAAGARLWIHNNSQADQTLVNGVIDNMTSEFITAGFTVVERAQIGLIASEQNLQLEGSISDSDFVSIGNRAGANTVVIVGVIGTGAARRLQVRVLDIETATVKMQSGTGVAWRL
jgi:hypothetical protein